MKQTSLIKAVAYYGPIVNGIWSKESQFMIVGNVPPSVRPFLKNSATGQLTNRIYLNKDMAGPLDQAFQSLSQAPKLLAELKTYDGCFCIRNVRGSTALSAHAYGLAIDLNAATNQMGCEPTFSKELVKCFTDAGFTWGGNFKRKDGMHFSYCWE